MIKEFSCAKPETPGIIAPILKKIGCDASDFSQQEIEILVALANRDLEFICLGRYYNYTLAGDKIFEVIKPTTCRGCLRRHCCIGNCMVSNEYDIIIGVNKIISQYTRIPYDVYYMRKGCTVLFGPTRLYSSDHESFIKLRDFDEAVGCWHDLPKGKYMISTEITVDCAPIKQQFTRAHFKVGDKECITATVRRSQFIRPTDFIVNTRASIFLEKNGDGKPVIYLITEPIGGGIYEH